MLNELAREIHEVAKEHGWWENGERNFGEVIALCHSELSEALEAYRKGEDAVWAGEDSKPEGVATEMVDCIIRILDYAAQQEWDVDSVMRAKIEYNKTRTYRHGGKTC